jgi:lipid-binding SYLF domain-containing protein
MCYEQLQHVQEELRLCNSNAMRYNAIDPTDARRLLNSPLAFTLGHEIRKAAYTLNNLLPLPKRMGAFVPSSSYFYGDGNFRFPSSSFSSSSHRTTEECQNACQTVSRNMSDLDGVRIPARLLERAKGVAVMTVIKGGLGFAGLEFGTGLVVARLGDGNEWSPPCAIGTAGVSWGALVGAQISDHVFLLMTDAAVNIMSNNEGSFQLGADIGVAVGPLGRSLEADIGAASGTGSDSSGIALAPIYTYSLSKGLYAGISLDGKVIVTRHRVNEKFYGHCVDARALLSGDVPTPPAAQPLYDALKRCHVYAGAIGHRESALASLDCHPNQKSLYYQYNMKPRSL